MTILSKACKTDNFESYNSLKLSFTNIRGLRLNFVDCESFLESNSPDILALCETNLDDSKDSSAHMHGLEGKTSFLKEGLPFEWNLSLENSYLCLCRFLLMFSTGFTSLSVSLLFPLSVTLFILCLVFDSISSNMDEILSINPSANVFVFGDF